MDIGSKIKNARVNANLTQEQAAESLGVSRQTISNWENEKTYPDIISIVKMSDLYAVSLDHLLKGERPASKYLNYLEESTNVVESKEKQTKLILIVVYLVIWAIALIVFWFFTSGSDAMAYSIMFLWGLLPIVTLVLSLLIGKNNYWGRYKWLSSVVFGTMYMLAYYATFSTANMVANRTVHAPDFMMIVYGAVFSLVGLAIGAAINLLQGRRNMKNVYVASIIKNGIMGGGIVVEDDKMTYRTGKITVPQEIRNLEMKYCDVQSVVSGRLFIFPTVEVALAEGKYKFIVFRRKRFLKDLRQRKVL